MNLRPVARTALVVAALVIVAPPFAAALDPRTFETGQRILAADFQSMWDAIRTVEDDAEELFTELEAQSGRLDELEGGPDVAARVTTLEGANVLIDQRLDLLEPAVSTLETEVKDLSGEVDAVNTSLAVLSGAIPALQSDVGGLDTRLTTAEGAIGDLQTDLTAAEAAIGTLQGDVKTADAAIVALQSDVTTAEDNILDLFTDLGDLQTDLTTAEDDITALQSDVSDAESDILALQSDVSGAQSAITDLQDDVGALQGALLDADDTLTVGTSGADYADLQAALDSLDAARIAAGTTITIELAAGTYATPAEIVVDHPDARSLVIQGASGATAILDFDGATSAGLRIAGGVHLGLLQNLELTCTNAACTGGSQVGLAVVDGSSVELVDLEIVDFPIGIQIAAGSSAVARTDGTTVVGDGATGGANEEIGVWVEGDLTGGELTVVGTTDSAAGGDGTGLRVARGAALLDTVSVTGFDVGVEVAQGGRLACATCSSTSADEAGFVGASGAVLELDSATASDYGVDGFVATEAANLVFVGTAPTADGLSAGSTGCGFRASVFGRILSPSGGTSSDNAESVCTASEGVAYLPGLDGSGSTTDPAGTSPGAGAILR